MHLVMPYSRRRSRRAFGDLGRHTNFMADELCQHCSRVALLLLHCTRNHLCSPKPLPFITIHYFFIHAINGIYLATSYIQSINNNNSIDKNTLHATIKDRFGRAEHYSYSYFIHAINGIYVLLLTCNQ